MDKLYAFIEQEDIKVMYDNIPQPFLGLYISKGTRQPIITLDNSLRSDDKLHRCILAEEIGHHFTSAGQSIYYTISFPFWEVNQAKAELKALRWSAMHLVPYKQLMQAVHKYKLRKVYELAEHFNVTIELMLFRLQFLQHNDFLCDDDLVSI